MRGPVGGLGVIVMAAAIALGFSEPELRARDTPSLSSALVGGANSVSTDYALMRRLESKGMAFSDVVGATKFGPVIDTIAADLKALYGSDPRAGVGMRYGHRLFDVQWLKAPTHRFELIAVAQRLDRAPFHRGVGAGACGELRLVYRLAYARKVADESVDSRLPMTVNVVRWLPTTSDCKQAAIQWKRGLSPTQIRALPLKSVEINLQSIRWPSTLHPSLAGHAEYILRVFEPNASGKLIPAPLEMTPDVKRIKSKPKLRRALLQWLADPQVQRDIDDGVAVVPDRFLATRAVSVTPRGLARPQNRPWRALLSDAEAQSAVLSAGRHVKTAAGLLRRLDTSTCQGCHQSRSVAGFHAVGEDDPSKDVDQVFNALSPHAMDDLPRRNAYLEAVAQGKKAPRARGMAERLVPSRVGKRGERCGLGDKSFADWSCGDGLICSAHDEAEVGVCAPKAPSVGDACQVGTVAGRPKGVDDRVRGVRSLGCEGAQFCESNRVGFPGGMCTTGCDEDDPSSPAGTVCGGIPRLAPFNRCIARGRPFPECILNNVTPKLLAACDATTACRDDYICAKTPDGSGACLPPYFLFQLRVDGH